jgi:hypothetical protein
LSKFESGEVKHERHASFTAVMEASLGTWGWAGGSKRVTLIVRSAPMSGWRRSVREAARFGARRVLDIG